MRYRARTLDYKGLDIELQNRDDIHLDTATTIQHDHHHLNVNQDDDAEGGDDDEDKEDDDDCESKTLNYRRETRDIKIRPPDQTSALEQKNSKCEFKVLLTFFSCILLIFSRAHTFLLGAAIICLKGLPSKI